MTKLKDFLKTRGATQGEAAALLGISEASLSGKAKGKFQFKQDEIKKLAEHYNMTDSELREVFL